jgi:hypothetical protein
MSKVASMDQAEVAAEIVLAVAAIVTVVFVGIQTRNLAKQVHTSNDALAVGAAQARIANNVSAVQAMEALSSSLQRVNLLFVEKPELRPYFYDKGEIPRDTELRNQVSALAEVMADYLETSLYTEDYLPDFYKENGKDLRNWIRFLREKSPVLIDVIETYPSWWPRLRLTLYPPKS